MLACSTAIALLLSAVILIFPQQVFELFTGDIAVLSVAPMLITPIVLNLFGAATRNMSFSLINGSGNTRLNLAVALIDGMISRMGIAALLGYGLNMDCLGFWYGDALAGFVPLLIGVCYLLSGRWKTFRSQE